MSRSPRRRRARRISLLIVSLALACAGTAWAATAPRSGTYRTKGAVKFTFKLTPGTCYLPPKNLHNYKAGRGKSGRGLCFSSVASVPVSPSCGADGHAISGLTADLSLFDRLRLASGSVHVKAYSYGSDPKPIGYTELDITVHGSSGKGVSRVTDVDGLNNPCDTGQLKFTIRHT